MAPEFTERRQLILKLVVQEFVASAAAVASDMLVRKYSLPVSSATVRNELATLEELGYLTQTHTSAGRVPTDAGYRFFVEHLMDLTPLPPREQQTIRQQLLQMHGEFEQWIQVGASVLARTAQNASVVTLPQAYQSRFKHLELIAIHDSVVLLVLVLHDGTVRQQTVTLDTAHSQGDLRGVSAVINEYCENQTVEQVTQVRTQREHEPDADVAPALRDLEQHILGLVIASMRQLEDQVNRQIYSDGLIEMLSQPEFLPALLKEDDVDRAVERLRQVLHTLTGNDSLRTLIVHALDQEGVHVVIGEEHGNDELRDYSVILSRYGVNGEVHGVLGIIGPTRMAYPRSISTVSYISTVMSDLLRDIYGIETRPDRAQS